MSDTFRLRPEHVAILRALSWEWNDSERWGGPGVDPKRLFGMTTATLHPLPTALGSGGEEEGAA